MYLEGFLAPPCANYRYSRKWNIPITVSFFTSACHKTRRPINKVCFSAIPSSHPTLFDLDSKWHLLANGVFPSSPADWVLLAFFPCHLFTVQLTTICVPCNIDMSNTTQSAANVTRESIIHLRLLLFGSSNCWNRKKKKWIAYWISNPQFQL